MNRPCPGADRAFSPRWRDDEAPTEDEPTDAPDRCDDVPPAPSLDRAASLEVLAFAVGSAALIAAILLAQHVAHTFYLN